ncbi:hypothetical protein DPMN_137901 [Dreissena polymorpha]|uniref:Uncharacterized protein n=1 Tax=Dreissena polymorpha TaxID=45954 RepID=A0A9D4G2U5_DREPO|nr:hypothetical protein DPMN_137901 [Dreissena polymorpha]
MMTPLSLSFVGLDKLSEAYGLAYLFCGIGVTVGPILIGYLYSILGTYEASFITAGLVLVIGSIFGFVSRCIRGQSRALTNTILIEDETHNPMEKTTNKKQPR